MTLKYENPLGINSSWLNKAPYNQIFDYYEEEFSAIKIKFEKLREELAGTEKKPCFFGKVSLSKCIEFEPRSALALFSAAAQEEVEIPTSKEWSAILFTAEAMARYGKEGEDKNNAKILFEDMTSGKIEITSSVVGWPGPILFENIFNNDESGNTNFNFPNKSKRVSEITALGLPKNSYVSVSIPRNGGLRAVIRGYWGWRHGEGRFYTAADWKLWKSSSYLASRVVVRKKVS